MRGILTHRFPFRPQLRITPAMRGIRKNLPGVDASDRITPAMRGILKDTFQGVCDGRITPAMRGILSFS